tara:strand:- start:189 stop:788 length:600 start_codon:yes stop_codon:yes gene_type:complete
MTKDIYFYTYVKENDLDSVMKHGLASSVRISEDKVLLERIFDNKKDRDAFVRRTDSSDVTQKGPSVFLSKPLSVEEIKDLDPEHALAKGKWNLIKINYSKLKSDDPSVYVYGLELVPYEDKEYDEVKSEVEGVMSEDKLNKYIGMSAEETWAEFKPMSGFFAANVPHGILINKEGLIDAKYLSLTRVGKISKLYNYISK